MTMAWCLSFSLNHCSFITRVQIRCDGIAEARYLLARVDGRAYVRSIRRIVWEKMAKACQTIEERDSTDQTKARDHRADQNNEPSTDHEEVTGGQQEDNQKQRPKDQGHPSDSDGSEQVG